MQCTDLVYGLLPRPWPKCQARTSLLVDHDRVTDQKLALRWTDSPREKGSVPLCRNDGEPSPYAEATPQSKTPPSGLLGDGLPGLLAGPPLLGAQEVPPEWAFSCVYLLLAVLQEYIYSISCLSLLLTRDLFGSCPGLLGVGEQGGGFGRKFGIPSRQGTPGPPLDLNHPTTRGPHRPPGTLSAH